MPGRERTLINEAGRIVVDPVCQPMDLSMRWDAGKPLTPLQKAMVSKYVLPGLDASLCRCDRCLELDLRGVWWVNMQARAGIYEDKKARRKAAVKL